MTPEHNEFVLSTAYHSGWINLDQYHSAAAALQAMPHLSAIDFLLEQTIITPEQAAGLREALNPAPPAVETAAVQTDDALEKSRHEPVLAEAHPEPRPLAEMTGEKSKLPDGLGIIELLRLGFDAEASDVHLGVSAPPLMRRHGTLQPLYHDATILTPAHTEALMHTFLNPMQLELLEKNKGVDFSYEVPGMARFRASVIHQRKGYDAVFRIINSKVRTMDELGLPEDLKVLTQYHNGLVLVTGAVGSGKSTTLAAMVQEINAHRSDHIITLEDPIEYVFIPAGCQITQREVHTHTESFVRPCARACARTPTSLSSGKCATWRRSASPLPRPKQATWSSPRSTPATRRARSTGCSTPFPWSSRARFRTMVSESLRGIVSQQLVPKADGTGRVVALEVMVNTPAVANLIRESKTYMLPGVIQTGKKLGMKLMDDSLLELVQNGVVTPHEAFDRAEQKKIFEPLLK